MKCIGQLGGMSWESTVSYYQALNRGVRTQLGGLHSARVLLNSVDFAEIERLQHAGDWPATAHLLAAEARKLQDGGADFLLIGTNTMHKVAPEIEAAIEIPLLHIADATAAKLQADGVTRVGLLG
ncbi:MAG: aspartate/glutamate racemase family protein, partial [Aeromonas sobria]